MYDQHGAHVSHKAGYIVLYRRKKLVTVKDGSGKGNIGIFGVHPGSYYKGDHSKGLFVITQKGTY